MRISHVVPSLEERHGGPSKSVRALANTQARLGSEITVFTTVGPGQPAPDTRQDSARIVVSPRRFPQRLCRSPELEHGLMLQSCDGLHHHSVWLLTLRYASAAAKLQRVPLVVSPRGMFSPWAYGRHRLRKKLAELLVHPGAFAAVAGWHATSPEEAADIRRLGFTQPICEAPNGVDVPGTESLAAAREAWWQALPGLRGHRVALFYSRFHRKKRVRELIRLWGSRPRGEWRLLVAGVPEEYTAAALAAEAAAQPYGADIVVADATGLPAPYALAELFLLPSHSENFGLVVAESLAAGVPALVTDTTPWQGLDRENAGRCVAWADYPAALAGQLDASPSLLAALGARARLWAAREFAWEQNAATLLGFYRHLQHA